MAEFGEKRDAAPVGNELLKEISSQAETAVTELLQVAKLQSKDIVVLGASSSEILGQKIGSYSSLQVAQAVFQPIYLLCKERGLFLAVQCCEHLNRALILEQDALTFHRYEPVNVVPQPHAGGAFAVTAYQTFAQPAAVEEIQASAGLDIGQTFIGMHMKPVAVPVRGSVHHIGNAVLSLCRSRPKYIGGPRADYDPKLF